MNIQDIESVDYLIYKPSGERALIIDRDRWSVDVRHERSGRTLHLTSQAALSLYALPV